MLSIPEKILRRNEESEKTEIDLTIVHNQPTHNKSMLECLSKEFLRESCWRWTLKVTILERSVDNVTTTPVMPSPNFARRTKNEIESYVSEYTCKPDSNRPQIPGLK